MEGVWEAGFEDLGVCSFEDGHQCDNILPPPSPKLRRIFGAEVVQSVDRQDTAEAAQRRRQAHAVRGLPQQARRRPLK